MILAAAVQFGFWADGCIRFPVGIFNVTAGPLGVLCYLPFVPVYWLLPAKHRPAYLWISSLLLALLTLGPGYAAMVAALAFGSFAIVRHFGTRRRSAAGKLILGIGFTLYLCFPQPPWLPSVPVPVYFYVHWAGVAYLFLRVYHVLADVAAGKLTQPRIGDFLAYVLFAPTLRMGPLYRFGEFNQQMATGPAAYRNFRKAGLRFLTGAIRLAIMFTLWTQLPDKNLFDHPEQLGVLKLLLHLQSCAMAFYLWMSGYADWSIAMGRLLGFEIPDNFDYPWRSLSIGEFWRRWHITLSSWLKDYLFIPLVRRRWHYFWSFTFTFLFCGFWHGLCTSYILFGLSQGVGLAVHRWWDQHWRVQRDRRTPLYLTLLRLKLVQSPINTAACWLLTYTYLVLAIDLAADVQHNFLLVSRRILSLLGLIHT